ncbi:MAG: diguanylate cyclase [Clostridiales bacterium]|nr:diguanylate cyclase [Clostridiales bacterium]
MESVIKNSILIVDDEPANQAYLGVLLGDVYTIYEARNGKEALEKANQHIPDLILLDILLPELNGYHVLSLLKSSEITQDIPVILISGLNSTEDEEKGLSLNAVDYIAKPFSDVIVRSRVNNQIRIINQMRAIERLSMIDQLTDIPNRRRFDQQLDMEWRRAARDQTPICLMMLDVDMFKKYNDTYGHQQGDLVLQAVAGTLMRTLKRPADFAARWGGEEFAVLLPKTEIDGALVISERIRTNIESTAIPCPGGTDTCVTISIGVFVQIPSIELSMKQFIANADAALYAAKDAGRNRICVFQQERNVSDAI